MLLTMIIDLILTVMTEIGMKAMIATTTNQMIHPLWNPSLPSCWKRRHLSLDASASQSRSHLPSTIIRRMTVTPSLIATDFFEIFSLIGPFLTGSYVPGQDFDPKSRQFSPEELRPQPMSKKSKKQVESSKTNPPAFIRGTGCDSSR